MRVRARKVSRRKKSRRKSRLKPRRARAAEERSAEALAQLEAAIQAREAAEERARNEAAAYAAAELKVREEAEAKIAAERRTREEAEKRAREEAELRIEAERAARAEAEAKADSERRAREEAERLAREEAQTQTEAARQARAEAEAKYEAARAAREQAEARAEDERRLRADAESRIEAEKQAREETERRAKEEVDRLAREEEERRARDEADRKAEQARREQERQEIESRIEAERKAREEAEAQAAAERKAREEAEARARADMEAQIDAERRAREEAEKRSRELAGDNTAAARQALEEAERKAEQARKIREEAEARLAEEKRAREQMEARMVREATVRAKLIARMEDERRARSAAEDRAKMEAVARVMQQREFQEKSETEVQQRVEGELKARQRAELDAEIQARREAEERAKVAAVERARQKEEEAQRAAMLLPRKRRNVAVPIAIAAIVLVIAAGALLQFMPLTPWASSAEKVFEERIGEPVSIGTMRYSLFPPELRMENVLIGRQQDIKVPSLAIAMGVGDLFSETKTIERVELQSPTIDQDALPRVLNWARAPVGPARTSVERVSARGARLQLRGMEPITLNAEAQIGKDGAVAKASFRLGDGGLAGDIVPKGDSVSLAVKGAKFTPPIGPAFVFEAIELTATITRAEMKDIQATASLYGGKVKAQGQARYDAGVAVSGSFAIDNLSLEPLVALFSRDVSITGGADMKGTFTLQGESLDKLFSQSRVDVGFAANRGSINNIDFVRAAQGPARDGVRGGRTRYTNMSGVLTVAGARASIQHLRVSSDSMAAAGAFDLSLPKGELNGRIGIQVGPRGTVVAQSNVAITGDARNPVLR
jgi:hypothetical protein